MRYGIISDIHGNLEALTAVIEECRNQGVRQIFCLGDIVGYGASPKECIEIIRRECVLSVAGNHDWAVCDKLDASQYCDDARKALVYHKLQLDDDDLSYLSNLKLVFKHDEFDLVHATLNKPDQFLQLRDISACADTFYLMSGNLCFVGHTHVPNIFIRRGGFTAFSSTVRADIHDHTDYIVNVGSVGQPRDGDPNACLCIYDPDLKRIEIKRIKYDIKSAHKRISDSGLPESSASRLLIGQ